MLKISVEGEVGSGRSTILRTIEDALRREGYTVYYQVGFEHSCYINEKEERVVPETSHS